MPKPLKPMLLVAGCCAVQVCTTANTKNVKQPNAPWVINDDQRDDALEC